MKFLIITHVPHLIEDGRFYAYAPYVNEMNLWLKNVDEVTIAAPIELSGKITPIFSDYRHENIRILKLKAFDLLSVRAFLLSCVYAPLTIISIFGAMRHADHIHLRCPGNIGLLGCVAQIFFPGKTKTAKYAGNWDPESIQPRSYRLQQKILSSTFLSKNISVLVYGKWPDSSMNIVPFFTATYSENEKLPLKEIHHSGISKFIFAGGLVAGKNPLYAVKLVESLYRKGKPVQLDIYGDGVLRGAIEAYISEHQLNDKVVLHGSQNKETIKKAYREAQFVILPSESEGWPKVIAEGMFWGCVPIATPVSCVPFMLDFGQNGVLLSMNLEEDASTIFSLLADDVGYEKKRNAAANWSRKYTLDVFETEIKKLLRK